MNTTYSPSPKNFDLFGCSMADKVMAKQQDDSITRRNIQEDARKYEQIVHQMRVSKGLEVSHV